MTAAQFWDEDPWLVSAYREAQRIRQQRKSDDMWLQGLYIHNAIGAVVGTALRKKGAKPLKYLEEPLRVTQLTVEEIAAKEDEEREQAVAYFNRLGIEWNKNH